MLTEGEGIYYIFWLAVEIASNYIASLFFIVTLVVLILHDMHGHIQGWVISLSIFRDVSTDD